MELKKVWMSKNRVFSTRKKALNWLIDLHDSHTELADRLGKEHKPSDIKYSTDKIRYSYCCVGYVIKLVELE